MHSPSGDVLVVDDNADMVEVLALMLGDAGYSVRSASNGKEALDAVAVRMPDVVLLDLLMPVMDGWQCARELRSRYGRAVPIVVVTAAEHARASAAQIGADDVLSKPFEVSLLLKVVEHHVVKTAKAANDTPSA
jgi:CheY-like chemotaxis protein